MRIVLCHTCWSWVAWHPRGCAECHAHIDLSTPDPSMDFFDELFGEPIARMGSIELPPRHLPSWGELWGLTHGFLFIPDMLQTPLGACLSVREANDLSTSRWSILPAWLKNMLFHHSSRRRPDTAGTATSQSSQMAGKELAALFLATPGSWFIPCKRITRVLRTTQHTKVLSTTRLIRLWYSRDTYADENQGYARLKQIPAWKSLIVDESNS
ncbi:MAG: hypothetical protein KatS3mg113_0903 [Planctomycetaceae bacterium]|nr:MAG: hypothetical protein KatS3mg113_0903 [Planctomycetaceae bacterium]